MAQHWNRALVAPISATSDKPIVIFPPKFASSDQASRQLIAIFLLTQLQTPLGGAAFCKMPSGLDAAEKTMPLQAVRGGYFLVWCARYIQDL